MVEAKVVYKPRDVKEVKETKEAKEVSDTRSAKRQQGSNK